MLYLANVLSQITFAKDVPSFMESLCAESGDYILVLLPDGNIPTEIKEFITLQPKNAIVYPRFTVNANAFLREQLLKHLADEESPFDPKCLKRNFAFLEDVQGLGEPQLFYQAEYHYRYFGDLTFERIGRWYDYLDEHAQKSGAADEV